MALDRYDRSVSDLICPTDATPVRQMMPEPMDLLVDSERHPLVELLRPVPFTSLRSKEECL